MHEGYSSSTVLYELHADMCKVFSHGIRLRILGLLRTSEKSVAEIAQKLGLALGTVSPHLLMMKRRRVLLSRREGNQVFYSIANPELLKAFDLIQKILSKRMQEEVALVKPGRRRKR